ncbi:iron-sulfur cluster assembly accessory protein [Buchnera aphidicola]|uniref:iron-sulfur cluster assembly accessory protein n=1 Tax=Buchnera aphidicola TaxID=9 RepID=UPI0034640C10
MKNEWSGITITKLAKKYLKSIIKKKKNIQAIEIKIKKSGCAGFKYSLSLLTNSQKKNIQKYYVYNQDNIVIYIPEKYMYIMDKTKIDFIKKDGINMSITFMNDKIKRFCGCGDSFYIQDQKILPTQ